MDELKWQYMYLRDKNTPKIDEKMPFFITMKKYEEYSGKTIFVDWPTKFLAVMQSTLVYLMIVELFCFTVLSLIMMFFDIKNIVYVAVFLPFLVILGVIELTFLNSYMFFSKYAIDKDSFIVKYPFQKVRKYNYENIEYFEICRARTSDVKSHGNILCAHKGIRCVCKGTSDVSKRFMEEGFSFYKDPIHKMFILGYTPELETELKAMGFRIRDISRAKSQQDTENIREL